MSSTKVDTKQVKELRERTGVSIMQCKKALEEAEGDAEKALVILRKASAATAAKKSDRTLGSGVVSAYVHSSKDVGAMLELLCETDFVAKNEEFGALAYDIAMHIAATNPQFLSRDEVTKDDMRAAKEVFEKEAGEKPTEVREKIVSGKLDSYLSERVLLEQSFIKDQGKVIRMLIEEAVQKFGERIEIGAYTRFSIRD